MAMIAAAGAAKANGHRRFPAQDRRDVGITVPLLGAPIDSGNAQGWCLPARPVAMIYHAFHVQVASAGTGRLVVWQKQGLAFRRARITPVTLTAGFNTLRITQPVPAGGTVSYEPVAGANMLVGGFSASTAHNFHLPCGGAIGAIAVPVITSADYGFGATGFVVDAAAAHANAGRRVGPLRYIVGVWDARASELATWAARGVNTSIGVEDDYSHPGAGEAWHSAWIASGLDLIHRVGRWRTPGWGAGDTRSQAKAEAGNARVIAWNLLDEPDVSGYPDQPGYHGAFDPDITARYVDREIGGLRKASATKPIYCNLSGYAVSLGLRPWKTRYLDDPGIDWWGMDQYPNVGAPAGFLMFEPTGTERFVSTCVGMAVAQIIQADFNFGGFATPAASKGKPVLFAVATGRVESTPGRAEEPGRFGAIIFSGIINGACGHYYFPQFINGPGGFVSDDTRPPILAAMTKVHAAIDLLNAHHALVDVRAGGRIAYRRRPCAFAPMTSTNQSAGFVTPRDDQLPGPFEGCEIYLGNGDTLRLVLNLTGAMQSLHDPRWGYAGLTFAAWEPKAFLASAPATNLFARLGFSQR